MPCSAQAASLDDPSGKHATGVAGFIRLIRMGINLMLGGYLDLLRYVRRGRR
jgi:hypothetical protein